MEGMVRAGSYLLAGYNDECHGCPKGLECPGLSSVSTRGGLDATGEVRWEEDSAGVLWLQQCPVGFKLVNNTGALNQECQECGPGPDPLPFCLYAPLNSTGPVGC